MNQGSSYHRAGGSTKLPQLHQYGTERIRTSILRLIRAASQTKLDHCSGSAGQIRTAVSASRGRCDWPLHYRANTFRWPDSNRQPLGPKPSVINQVRPQRWQSGGGRTRTHSILHLQCSALPVKLLLQTSSGRFELPPSRLKAEHSEPD